jgi:class 3 adenylate cyclase/FixJ family two-component response regulator
MSNPTILCVDDEKIVLVSLKQQLRRLFGHDYAIETAESGDEALEIAEELFEDGIELPLIISDQIMPGMKGDELLAEVHALSPKTLTIMLTGQANVNAVGSAVNHANLYRYIAKPWEQADLGLTVTEAVRSYFQDKALDEQNDILQQLHRNLKQLNKAYVRFVPVEYLNFLGKESIIDLQLGDQVSKEMAIMFSCIHGFSALSKGMSPQENFNFVNAYLKQVSPVIREHRGIIVKYLADGMMVIFPNGVDDAVKAALAKLKEVAQYNHQRHSAPKIDVGIGIHCGKIMVGIVGEAARMQGDAFSDHVNLTARLRGLSKLYGAPLVISKEALSQLSNPSQYQLRFLPDSRVKGKKYPISTIQLQEKQPKSASPLTPPAHPATLS